MPQFRDSLLTIMLSCAIVLPSALTTVQGQTASTGNVKLALKAVLVLTPEFCATKTKKGGFWSGKETFPIGKAACKELEPALKEAFSDLTRVAAAPASGDAQVVLTPRLVDVGATKALGAFSNREMVVLLEWTVKDKAGTTLWLETVQGSAKHHMGNAFTHGKNVKLIAEDSVKDAAEQSATKMSAAPELRKLANTNGGSSN